MNSYSANNPDLILKYMLSNPMGLSVKHTVSYVPKIGDKVKIIDDMGFNKNQVRELVKLNDIVTVEDVNPIVIGEDGNYHWEYEIYSQEFPNTLILGWHYKSI